MRLIKKLGYKTVTEFYQDIANETRDANDIIEKYLELKEKGNGKPGRYCLSQRREFQHADSTGRQDLQRGRTGH